MDIYKHALGFERDSLLPHYYRSIGIGVCLLIIPEAFLFDALLQAVFNLESSDQDQWGLYTVHLLLTVGLYFILFSREKSEDEFYLDLRLRAVTRGVMMIVVAMVMMPVFANLSSLFIGRELVLPDVGGNMAVCTLLLFYANIAYFFSKFRMVIDD
ncbi:MAG: hypothetical protein WA958_07895 [Tunicatimonas sp.]